jgi:hypothetical protein
MLPVAAKQFTVADAVQAGAARDAVGSAKTIAAVSTPMAQTDNEVHVGRGLAVTALSYPGSRPPDFDRRNAARKHTQKIMNCAYKQPLNFEQHLGQIR